MKGHVIGTVFKWILYFSSYVPVFFMIFLKKLKAFTGKEFQKTWNLNSNFWIILIVMSVLTLIALIFWLIILKKETEIKTKSIEVSKYVLKDSEVLNFFVTYIIPILSLEPNSLPSIVMNLILIIIEGIYFVGNNAVYYNVMLILMGYHIYAFGNNNIVITRLSNSELVFNKRRAKQVGTTNIYYISGKIK